MQTRSILMIAGGASVAVASLLIASMFSVQQATAQTVTAASRVQHANSIHQIFMIPSQLKGSISVQNFTNGTISKAKVSISSAAEIAQKQVPNGVVTGGRLTEAQGFLVYAFNVSDVSNQTSSLVLVDPGNGNVLYTGSLPQAGSDGLGCPHGASGTDSSQQSFGVMRYHERSDL